jgi:hypothetical protein
MVESGERRKPDAGRSGDLLFSSCMQSRAFANRAG